MIQTEGNGVNSSRPRFIIIKSGYSLNQLVMRIWSLSGIRSTPNWTSQSFQTNLYHFLNHVQSNLGFDYSLLLGKQRFGLAQVRRVLIHFISVLRIHLDFPNLFVGHFVLVPHSICDITSRVFNIWRNIRPSYREQCELNRHDRKISSFALNATLC